MYVWWFDTEATAFLGLKQKLRDTTYIGKPNLEIKFVNAVHTITLANLLSSPVNPDWSSSNKTFEALKQRIIKSTPHEGSVNSTL